MICPKCRIKMHEIASDDGRALVQVRCHKCHHHIVKPAPKLKDK